MWGWIGALFSVYNDLSHSLPLPRSFSRSLILTLDAVKSEDRQKLAKERREEKAKYLGKLRWRVERRKLCTQGEDAP